MKSPVTAIIPCYRGQATLARALDSVRAQTRPPEEILIVDDGNEAAVAAELDAIAARYPDARVLHLRQNVGLASARNAGWDQARARYVAFLDDDDAWHPRKLELQLAVMEAHPEAILTATGVFLAQGSPAFREPPAQVALRAYPLRRSLIVNPSRPSTWIFRRQTPRRFQAGWRHLEDFLLLLELLLDGEVVLHLDWPLVAIFKPLLSSGGLTGQLWKMEMAELATYRSLRDSGRLGLAARRSLQAISLIKFLRRLVVVKLLRR